jgi:virulence factor
MAPLKAAVIGVGGIAKRVHIPTLIELPEFELSTLVDINPVALEEVGSRFNVPRRFTSVEQFLDNPQVDCAFVVTGPTAHTGPTVALLNAAIDVFCEKPLAHKLTDIRSMVKAAQDKDCVFMAGFNRRFMPVYLAAQKAFESRHLNVLSIEKNKSGVEFRPLLNDGIHMVDTMRWYCGEPVEVEAFSRYTVDNEHEESIVANIRFDSGTLGMLVILRDGGGWVEKAELYGGGCTSIVYAADRTTITADGREEVFSVSAWAGLADRLGFVGEFKHFAECVREHKQPITNGPDALKTHELTDAIYRKAGLPGL